MRDEFGWFGSGEEWDVSYTLHKSEYMLLHTLDMHWCCMGSGPGGWGNLQNAVAQFLLMGCPM